MTYSAAPTAAHLLGRIGAGVVGGWLCTWGFSVLGIAGLVALGQPYEEARTAIMLLAFLVFLTVFCWAFAAASLARVWLLLAGGGALMTAAAWLLQASLT